MLKDFGKKTTLKLLSFLAQNYYFVQACRYIVQAYDNDCNADIVNNGELKLIQALCEISTEEDLFIDIGANKGDYSYLVFKSGWQGEMLAIDPLQKNLDSVKSKISNSPKLHLTCCALADFDGEGSFYTNRFDSQSGTDSLYDMNQIGYLTESEVVNIPVKTLNTLVEHFPPVLSKLKILFIKVDVEGGELNIFRGAKDILDKVDYIQFEFGHAARAAKVNLIEIYDYFQNLNMNLYVLKPKGLLKINRDPFLENRYSYINFLASRDENVLKLVKSGLKDFRLLTR